MLIVFTDEVGEDQHLLESCVQLCRHSAIPVYVVGVPSPFGRKEAIVKWVDPDPAYDQSPQHGRVDQGPESLYPERIKLRFPGQGNVDPILDSGFGPFALTRLCYESGGIYFAVHPNRRVGRDIRGHATQPYASYIRRFFDPETMRQYRPDYVSRDAYVGNVRQLRSRMALVQAAKDSWATSLSTPRTRFVKRNEASLVQQLTRAQKAAAILEPQLDRLYEVLKAGESDREKENVPRWQAGYDLALGRALAAKVRTSGYNMMLAKAKQGMKFQDDQQNTWIMRPAGELDLGSQMNNYATQATEYLERVVAEHPGTPWAYLAERELDHPIGWKWTESYTELEPERDQNTGGGNNNRLPRDDQRRMLERPKPKRPLPKL